jgi:ribosomal protein S27AE
MLASVGEPLSPPKLKCPRCGADMNHHADKLLAYYSTGSDSEVGTLLEMHSCPACGAAATRSIPGAF